MGDECLNIQMRAMGDESAIAGLIPFAGTVLPVCVSTESHYYRDNRILFKAV